MNDSFQSTNDSREGQDVSLGTQRSSPSATSESRRPTEQLKLRVPTHTKLTLELAAHAANQTLSAYVAGLIHREQGVVPAPPDPQIAALRAEIRAARGEIDAALRRCNSHGGLVKQLWDAIDRRDTVWADEIRFRTLSTIDDFRAAALGLEHVATTIVKRLSRIA